MKSPRRLHWLTSFIGLPFILPQLHVARLQLQDNFRSHSALITDEYQVYNIISREWMG